MGRETAAHFAATLEHSPPCEVTPLLCAAIRTHGTVSLECLFLLMKRSVCAIRSVKWSQKYFGVWIFNVVPFHGKLVQKHFAYIFHYFSDKLSAERILFPPSWDWGGCGVRRALSTSRPKKRPRRGH